MAGRLKSTGMNYPHMRGGERKTHARSWLEILSALSKYSLLPTGVVDAKTMAQGPALAGPLHRLMVPAEPSVVGVFAEQGIAMLALHLVAVICEANWSEGGY